MTFYIELRTAERQKIICLPNVELLDCIQQLCPATYHQRHCRFFSLHDSSHFHINKCRIVFFTIHFAHVSFISLKKFARKKTKTEKINSHYIEKFGAIVPKINLWSKILPWYFNCAVFKVLLNYVDHYFDYSRSTNNMIS